jgi:L-malate glycosyltransferase
MNTEKKHSILIITDIFLGMAGSERNIGQLITHADPRRFQFYLASIEIGKLGDGLRQQGFPVYALRKGGIYTINGFKNILFLQDLIRKNKISLIVTYHEASDFYGLVLSKLCHIPIVTSRRDMGFKTRWHHRMAYRLLGGYFDGVVTVSDAVKQEMIRRDWFPALRIFSIYNGVDLKKYDLPKNQVRLKRQLGITPDHMVVGLIGNVRRIKGLHHFIEAAAIVHKQNADIQFIIVGGGPFQKGYTISDLMQLAKENDVLQNLHFVGHREDIPELISLFDIAVVASLSEGFSNSILEYMASSKPVIATRVGGNAEAVCDGKTGLLVSPADPRALATAIWSVIADKKVTSQFGKAARIRAERLFSLDEMIKNYESYFEYMIADEKRDTHKLPIVSQANFAGSLAAGNK